MPLESEKGPAKSPSKNDEELATVENASEIWGETYGLHADWLADTSAAVHRVRDWDSGKEGIHCYLEPGSSSVLVRWPNPVAAFFEQAPRWLSLIIVRHRMRKPDGSAGSYVWRCPGCNREAPTLELHHDRWFCRPCSSFFS